MTKSKVVIVHCESYEYGEVRAAVHRGFQLLGGASRFAGRGCRVLMKPNLLAADPPEKCVTTHPSVFRAVAEEFLATGAVVSYGDSPAFGSMSAAAKKAGIASVAADLGIPEADFHTSIEMFFRDGTRSRRFTVARAVSEADVIVSIPKLKTHGFQKITACVKNQFGFVPGFRKGEYHVKIPDANHFARMLVELTMLIHPALYVVDAVRAMEGNGPRGGTPRAMNLLLLSTDPIAADAVAGRLIGLDPLIVPCVRQGIMAGAGAGHETEIEVVGDELHRHVCRDFRVDRTELRPYRTAGLIRFVGNRFVPRPRIVANRCVMCGQCIAVCPTSPKSIGWIRGDRTRPPVHRYRTCIRCYCCQEGCPEGAIELDYPLLGKIVRI